MAVFLLSRACHTSLIRAAAHSSRDAPSRANRLRRLALARAMTSASSDVASGAAKTAGGSASAPAAPVLVSSAFDSGNIQLVNLTVAAGDGAVHELELHIRPDPHTESENCTHYQWFHFRVSNVAGRRLAVRLSNAGGASFPYAFGGYNVAASYDTQDWFRVPSKYSEGVLSWELAPEAPAVHFAYFAPYSQDRHAAFVGELAAGKKARLEVLGHSLDGRDLDLLTVGEPGQGKRVVWVVARQHPGESMAEWAAEGLLRRLTDEHDPVARKLLQGAVFYVVPNINPDGSFRGHLRTNAAGANLNREWAAPSLERSPEVLLVKRRMQATGCDLLLDLHGDEAIPAVFLVGNEGVPSWDSRMANLQSSFKAALLLASPDFQTERGYPLSAPGQANLSLCSKNVGEAFGCLSFTIEMPFKDAANHAEPRREWSPQRSARLGGALLDATLAVLPRLR